MKMKTLLLNLPININKPKDFSSVLQPIGLLSISSYLKQQNCDVVLFDAYAHHYTKKQILKYVVSLNPDILGVTLFTNHLPQAMPFFQDVKKLLPNITIVVGGAHPSSDYTNLITHNPEVDIAVIGEGEYTLYEIIQCKEKSQSLIGIKGIAYKRGDEVVVNSFRVYIDDLDSLPFGDWQSLPMENYFEIWTVKKNYAHMILSRGCPFSCTFCGAKKALGRIQRRRSPKHILEEVTLLYDKYDVRNILFGDSTFNMDKKWIHGICEGLLSLDRPLIWNCNIRADLVELETVKLMKKSGCDRVFLGVESADDEMLKRMKKGESLEEIEQGIRYLQEGGINPDMGFILGMPGETAETMGKTIKFALRHKKCMSAFTLAAPFPATPLYDEAKKEGFIVDDWAKFDIYKIAYVPQGLTPEILISYYKKTVRRMYLRPSFLIRRLAVIRSWLSLAIHIRFAFRVFFCRLFQLK